MQIVVSFSIYTKREQIDDSMVILFVFVVNGFKNGYGQAFVPSRGDLVMA